MTAPNIVSVATITGKTDVQSLASASATSVLSNAAGSNNVLKINSIILSNIDGSSAVTGTVSINSAAAGAGTNVHIVQDATVSTGSSLVVIDKSVSFYLEEDRSIVVTPSGADDVAVTISYEIITD